MKTKLITLILILAVAAFGCKNKTTINQNDAGEVISSYLEANPEYKIGKFKFGEMKFNSKSDMVELEKYKTLENEGLVTLQLEKSNKKFLSKDSSFTYLIKLTEKASNLVLKQENDRANVKVVEYLLADGKPVNFEQVNAKSARVTVTLKKNNTAFAPFENDKNANSEFITKTYKLKLDKDEGWKVVR